MAAPRLGQVVGSIAGLLWGGLLLLGFIECGLHTLGVVGTTHEYRRLSGIEVDPEETSRSVQEIEQRDLAWELTLRLVILAAVWVGQLIALYVHWRCYIRPTSTKYMSADTAVPADLQGSFKYGLCDCSGSCGTCCCFFWCQPCMLSDYWYRSGWLHALLGEGPSSCAGWQFIAGAFGGLVGLKCFGCCFPCAAGTLRGGAPSGPRSAQSFGEVLPFRTRFGIKHEGFSTFVSDCCTWCWCFSCAGTQEYRQVMDVLDRAPPAEGLAELGLGAPAPVVMAEQALAFPVEPTAPRQTVGPAVQVDPLPVVVQGTVVRSWDVKQ